MKIEELLKYFFSVRTQTHLWHLQTGFRSEHDALKEFYPKWIEIADKFTESYSGKYGRPVGGMTFNVIPYEEGASLKYMRGVAEFMLSREVRSISPDSDLQNILDEMTSLAKHTSNMLTLKH